MSYRSALAKSSAWFVIALSLANCGGGGGGGSSTASVVPASLPAASSTPAPGASNSAGASGSGGSDSASSSGNSGSGSDSGPTSPGTAANWTPGSPTPSIHGSGAIYTAEYAANYALDRVGAGQAYVAGWTGYGQAVAVVDSGIADIGKLQGQVLAHINVTAESTINDSHGTVMGAIIAAAKTGSGAHGVAYESHLVDIKASQGGAFADADVAAAIRIGAGLDIAYGVVTAPIINLAIGGPLGTATQGALQDAVHAGKLIVLSAGSGGNANPDGSALFATTAAANGQAIIVGAALADGTIAPYSNKAGSGKAFYLVAPADQIVTYDANGNQVKVSGATLAAPMVSGAAAILEQEFPNLTAAQIVQILLTTADPLGSGTADETYGHGMLDIGRAIQPIGEMSIPTGNATNGSAVALSLTGMSLGPAFGTEAPQSTRSVGFIALDSYQRGYVVSLSNAFVPMRDTFDFYHAFIDGSSVLSAGRALLQAGDEVLPGNFALASIPATIYRPNGMAVALALGPGTVAEVAQHVTPLNLVSSGLPDAFGAGESGASLFLRSDSTVLPQAGFFQDARGAGITKRFGAASFSFATVSAGAGYEDFTSEYHFPKTDLMQLDAEWRLGALDLGFGVGRMREDDRALGSYSAGALALGRGATSTFLTVMGHVDAGWNSELAWSFTEGYSDFGSPGGLIQKLGLIRSNAFSVSALHHDALVGGDVLGLQLAQPLRVTNANLQLTLPVALDAEGTIYHVSRGVDLAPRGREMDLQLAWRAPLAAVVPALGVPGEMNAFAMARMEPGHNADAPTDLAVGVRVALGF